MSKIILSSSSSSSSSECSAQGQVFHCKPRNQGCSSAQGRSYSTSSGTKIAVLLWINGCGRFPLLSAPQSLFSMKTDLKRSEKIQKATAWRSGEWIWLTGPSGFHQNSSQGLNISSIRDLTRSEIRKYQSPFPPNRRIELKLCIVFIFKL